MKIGKKTNGFTLIELLIAVAIIGLLSSYAVAEYRLFVVRAKFTEAIVLANKYKIDVINCIQQNDLNKNDCMGGVSNERFTITDNLANPYGHITNAFVAWGVIYIQTDIEYKGDILQIAYTPYGYNSSGIVKWIVTGTCFTSGVCTNSM